jgi:hypothetical protein
MKVSESETRKMMQMLTIHKDVTVQNTLVLSPTYAHGRGA